MSEQLYTTADVVKATGRSQSNLNLYLQRADAGHMCGKYRVLTDYEFKELCRLDRIAKEKNMDFGPLVVGCFSNRKPAFPYSTVEQVADFNNTSKTNINKWIGKGLLEAIKVGTTTGAVFLLDQENQAKAKRLADELKARMPEKPKHVDRILIDPTMIKFSVSREMAWKLVEYLKKELGEAK